MNEKCEWYLESIFSQGVYNLLDEARKNILTVQAILFCLDQKYGNTL